MLHPITIEPIMISIAVLLVLSVAASKVSERFGIPALLFFLALGMLAGSEGIGGIYFDDPQLAQNLGIVALVIILFSGGLDTNWKRMRGALGEGILLATCGVLLTALLLGWFAHWILHITLLEGFLLGAIVSSTDAAAVFSILRSQGIHLTGKIQPLLEFESGSNDPVAVFLTIGLISLILHPQQTFLDIIPAFFLQMGVGLVCGLACGKLALMLINRLRLGFSGLYPVLMVGVALFTYGVTNLLSGSGFLAVYLCGLVMGREEFLHKRSLLRFGDGLAWLMQIVMFLTLGLLVFPSKLLGVFLPALAISAFLMFIARPLSVMLSLSPIRMRIPEKLFVSWVGLRGAVPIVLATYPRIMGVGSSDLIFDVVFFVVLTSILVQGTSIPWAARKLGVEAENTEEPVYPLEFTENVDWKGNLTETLVPADSWAVGKAVFQLGLPKNYLIVLISRGQEYVIPNGGVILQAEDRLLGLSTADVQEAVRELLQPPGAAV